MKRFLLIAMALMFTIVSSVSAITIAKTEQGVDSIKISGTGWATVFHAKKIYVDGVNVKNFNAFSKATQIAEVPLTSGIHYVFAMEGDTQSNTLTVKMINFNEAMAGRYAGISQLMSYDSSGNIVASAGIDRILGSLVTIGELHHMTHRGMLYIAGNAQTRTALTYYMVQAKSNTVHARISLGATADSSTSLYEAGTVSAVGTTITPRNQNRNVTDTQAIIDVYALPTVTANGTLLYSGGVGAGGNLRVGGEEQTTEWVLKPNTTYLIGVTPSASAELRFGIEFYKQEDYD